MKKSVTALLLIAISLPGLSSAVPIETSDLCGLLEAVEPGDELLVVLSGTYDRKIGLLYSPEQPVCPMDLQPSTFVDFPDSVKVTFRKKYEEMERIAKKDLLVNVVLEGILHGRKTLGKDDKTLPAFGSFAKRSTKSRHGHHYDFRTKLEVTTIHSVEQVPDPEILPQSRFQLIDSPMSTIRLLKADIPSYPDLAKNTGIQGKVVLQAQIVGGHVRRIEILNGDRMLSEVAVENMRTWLLDPDLNRVITTSFVYRMESRPIHQRHRIEVDFDLPRRVTIIGSTKAW